MNLISINMGLLLTSGQRPPPPPPPSPRGSPAEQNTDRQRKFVFYLQESLLSSSESGTLIVERPAEDQLEVSDSPGLSAKEGGWFRFSTWKIPRNTRMALFFPPFDKPLLEERRNIASLRENRFQQHTGTITPSLGETSLQNRPEEE